MLADVILEWSGGGIFCPSSRSGGWSGTEQISWSGVRKRVPSEKHGAYPSLLMTLRDRAYPAPTQRLLSAYT